MGREAGLHSRGVREAGFEEACVEAGVLPCLLPRAFIHICTS